MKIKRTPICLLGLTAVTANTRLFSDTSADSSSVIDKILTENPIFDGHNNLPWILRQCLSNKLYTGQYDYTVDASQLDGNDPETWFHDCTDVQINNTNWIATDHVRSTQGYHRAQFWSVYVSCDSQYQDSIRQTVEQIDVVKRLADYYPDLMQFCLSSDCVKTAWTQGKFASLLGMNGLSIDSSLAMIRIYARLGVRYMTLTKDCNTPFADSAIQEINSGVQKDYIGGLTKFGEKVILEMNRNGVLVDLSEVSSETMAQALNVSQVPVIFSHSNAFGIYGSARNVRDEILRKLAENGGVIMVNFSKDDLTDSGKGDLDYKVISQHIQYVREVTGSTDHVSLGSNFDGKSNPISGMGDVSMYPKIFLDLYENYHWSEDDLAKLASGNILRVLSASEQYVAEQDPLNFDESWISQPDLDRISDPAVISDSQYKPNCKTDYELNQIDDDSTYVPVIIVEDTAKQQSVMVDHAHSKYQDFYTYQQNLAANPVQVDGHNDMPWQFRQNVRNAIKKLDLTKNMRDDNTDEYWIPNHTDFARAKTGKLRVPSGF